MLESLYGWANLWFCVHYVNCHLIGWEFKWVTKQIISLVDTKYIHYATCMRYQNHQLKYYVHWFVCTHWTSFFYTKCASRIYCILLMFNLSLQIRSLHFNAILEQLSGQESWQITMMSFGVFKKKYNIWNHHQQLAKKCIKLSAVQPNTKSECLFRPYCLF